MPENRVRNMKVASASCSVVSDSLCPHGCSPPAPLAMGFSRQDYWSRWPLPSPGDLPDPGIHSLYPALQADSLPSEPWGKPYLNTIGSCFQHSVSSVPKTKVHLNLGILIQDIVVKSHTDLRATSSLPTWKLCKSTQVL